jgi:hypothetical protein
LLRALVVNPLIIIALCLLAMVSAQAAHLHIHQQDIILAAGSTLIASELALLPLLFCRRASQDTVAQAGLISTVVHLFLSAGIGFAVSACLRLGQPFLYWLVMFYWATLITISIVAVRAVKAAIPRVRDFPIK